jgi:hypothetical protein
VRRKGDEGIHKSCLETITPSDQRLSSVRRLSRISAVRWRGSQRFCKPAHADCRNANPRYGARSIGWFEPKICQVGSAMQVRRSDHWLPWNVPGSRRTLVSHCAVKKCIVSHRGITLSFVRGNRPYFRHSRLQHQVSPENLSRLVVISFVRR